MEWNKIIINPTNLNDASTGRTDPHEKKSIYDGNKKIK